MRECQRVHACRQGGRARPPPLWPPALAAPCPQRPPAFTIPPFLITPGVLVHSVYSNVGFNFQIFIFSLYSLCTRFLFLLFTPTVSICSDTDSWQLLPWLLGRCPIWAWRKGSAPTMSSPHPPPPPEPRI